MNTYLFINAEGKERYFKMNWLPAEGTHAACLKGYYYLVLFIIYLLFIEINFYSFITIV